MSRYPRIGRIGRFGAQGREAAAFNLRSEATRGLKAFFSYSLGMFSCPCLLVAICNSVMTCRAVTLRACDTASVGPDHAGATVALLRACRHILSSVHVSNDIVAAVRRLLWNYSYAMARSRL
jgi:hypothetical protein